MDLNVAGLYNIHMIYEIVPYLQHKKQKWTDRCDKLEQNKAQRKKVHAC